jgi:hypothetical protein
MVGRKSRRALDLRFKLPAPAPDLSRFANVGAALVWRAFFGVFDPLAEGCLFKRRFGDERVPGDGRVQGAAQIRRGT